MKSSISTLFKILITTTLLGASLAQAENPKVLFETTAGNFVIELNAEKAPVTVENFMRYVNTRHFEGTIFHRVIPDFMVQGGGFTVNFEQKDVFDPIVLESNNGLYNNFGTVAMARTSVPDSATAQFFVNVKDNDFLNYSNEANPGYAVFGKVTEGMDIIMEISTRPTGPGGKYKRMSDVPVVPVIIEKVIVLNAPAAE